MIKFFRKIRRKLLVENSIKKYLPYAFGEIALIMIGILLALQVNNWNEKRKEFRRAKDFVKEIHEDLKNDVRKLNWIIERFEDQKKGARSLLIHLEGHNHAIQDSSQFVYNTMLTNTATNVQRRKSLWDELEASGQTGNIPDDSLSYFLLEYYESYDTEIFYYSETAREVRQDNRTAMVKCLDLSSIDRFWTEDKSYNRSWFTCFTSNPKIKEEVSAIYNSCFFRVQKFTSIKKQAQAIIDYIERHSKI